MGDKSGIQWTDATWSPIRARVREDAKAIAESKGYTSLLPIIQPGRVGPHCEHTSPGCTRCYSETNNSRCLPTNGTGLPFDRRSRDLVEVFVDEKILAVPFHWRKPRKIFVCSQTDLFGEFVSNSDIYAVLCVIAQNERHTFQILTKQAARMQEYMERFVSGGVPLSNLWLGVSAEDQQRADERIPLLLKTPATVRFVSYEPAIGPVDFKRWLTPGPIQDGKGLRGREVGTDPLDLIIIGGESGPGARPFNIEWAQRVIEQCDATGAACFVKQVGAKPMLNNAPYNPHGVYKNDFSGRPFGLYDKKGGNPMEWPVGVNVRQFPEVRV